MDILLSDEHDISLDGGDFKLSSTAPTSLQQRLRIKLLTYQEEWFLDVDEGIPYYQSILGKNRAKETIDLIFKNAILAEPEVLSLESFSSSIDNSTRVYSLSFVARSAEGNALVPLDITI
jgi:hypothetical protein